jgi:hypothetical protein
MDIQSIRKIIFPAVSDVVSKLEEENHSIKITFLREIFNEAINGALNISHTNNTSIKAMFSGRGRAWASTTVSNDNPVWISIRHTLNKEILYSDPSSKQYKECTNLLDTFESAGFAWMRFDSVSKSNLRFKLRTKGSKLEHHIKFYTDSCYINRGYIKNLEGVPHRLGLESGNFEEENVVKEVIEKPVSKEELHSVGIKTLEDILS